MESRRNGPQLSSRHDDDDDGMVGRGLKAVAYLPLGHLGHAPTFELRKKSRLWQKMQPKCAIFRQKSQQFSGEGAQGKYP